MNKFSKRHKLLKLTQEEINNMNRPITNEETELITKKLLQRKAQAQMASSMNSTIHLKKN